MAEAVERGREAVDVARQDSDTANIMFALPHLGDRKPAGAFDSGSARDYWWAVKGSNLGLAD